MKWLLVVLAIAGVAFVRSNLTWEKRKYERELRQEVHAHDRYVDVGVTLVVVVADPNGQELVRGKPRVREVRRHSFGGLVDTRMPRPQVIAASRQPTVWYCSEDQEAVILHPDDAPLGVLAIGSEGSGKTTALAIWLYLRWLEHMGDGYEGGLTAPTRKRIGNVRRELERLWPSTWYSYASRKDFEGFELVDGTRIRCVSTHRQSAKQGSPIQGFNWSFCARDELQDQVDAHEDIESRGRDAKNGRYKQIATATAKDDSAWRTLRVILVDSGEWARHTMLIARSPFVPPSFLERKRKTMTEREFRRRYMAEDLPPENRVYFNWQVDTDGRRPSMRRIPAGAQKITSTIIALRTGDRSHQMGCGHDPGIAKAASILVDAYKVPGDPDPVWFVRGELFTLHKTAEQHALQLRELVRQRFAMNVPGRPEQVHVRAQPIGTAEDKPDLSVYQIFRRLGFDIRAAQHRKDGTGTGHIAVDARLEMVNTLLLDASGRRRLFVECDDRGRPVAPRLVAGLETMQRDERGRAVHGKKDETDLSDCPDALGYILWPFEKESAPRAAA